MSALHRGYRTFAVHHEKSSVPAIFKVSTDHLFANLESGKIKYCFGKSLEKVLNCGFKNLYEPCGKNALKSVTFGNSPKLSLPLHTKVLQLCVAISSAGTRPLDKRGGGAFIQTLRWGGEGGWGSPKKFFSTLRTSVWSKNKGEGGGLGPFPLSATDIIFARFGLITFKLGNFPNFKVHFATLSIDNRLLVFISARVYYFDTF